MAVATRKIKAAAANSFAINRNQMLDDWRAGGSAVEGRANDVIRDT